MALLSLLLHPSLPMPEQKRYLIELSLTACFLWIIKGERSDLLGQMPENGSKQGRNSFAWDWVTPKRNEKRGSFLWRIQWAPFFLVCGFSVKPCLKCSFLVDFFFVKIFPLWEWIFTFFCSCSLCAFFPFLRDHKKSALASGDQLFNCDGRLFGRGAWVQGMKERDSSAMGGGLTV